MKKGSTVKKELDKAVGNIFDQIEETKQNEKVKKNLYKINACCKDLLRSMINKKSILNFDIGFNYNSDKPMDGKLLIGMDELDVKYCPFCGFEIDKL